MKECTGRTEMLCRCCRRRVTTLSCCPTVARKGLKRPWRNCRSRICCSSLRRWDSPGKNAAKKEKQPTARRTQSHTFLMTAQRSSMSVGKWGTHTPMPCTPGTTSTQQGIGISGRLPISFCWTRVQHEPLPVAFKPLTKGPCGSCNAPALDKRVWPVKNETLAKRV